MSLGTLGLLAMILLGIAGYMNVSGKWREERQRLEEQPRMIAETHLATIAELRNRIADLSKSDAGRLRVNPRDGLRYTYIPAGEFQMGCSTSDGDCQADEKPAHKTIISKAFWIGQTEVTQEAYEKVRNARPSNFPGPDRPVEKVTWSDAATYCEKIGMRLPTEAEWEYAARAGVQEAHYGELRQIAWYQENSGGAPHSVATRQPNAWGLYDMSGNVWEWTNDWFDPKYYSSASETDPPGPANGAVKVVRGGSWNILPGVLRLSDRNSLSPTLQYDNLGFRCAGDLP